MDVVVSVSGLVVLWPLLLIIAVLIRIRIGSPVIFRQTRPGLNGELFELLKFRSMRDGDEPDEERLTEFGKKLRSLSLDELPELINIARGDMSLVGPRPLLTEYLPLYSERQARRHEVRPGLTGLAQVSGRNLVGWDDRFELDVEYVDTHSLVGDVRILIQTIQAVLTQDGISSAETLTMHHFLGSETGDPQ